MPEFEALLFAVLSIVAVEGLALEAIVTSIQNITCISDDLPPNS